MTRLPLGFIVAAIALSATVAHPTPMASSGFTKAAPIAAPDDGWDFANWDAPHARLLVAHGHDVLVIDPAHPDAVRAIGTVERAHGVVAIPGTDMLIVASGGDNTVRVLNEINGAQVARIAVAANPDAILLSPDATTAFVMCAKAGAISIIDLRTLAELGRIPLKAGLEVPVWAAPGIIAVNNEDASEVELADVAAHRSVGTIPLPGCEGPTGFAIALDLGLALSACANGKAALVDLKMRKLLTLVPIGTGPDTTIWDAAHRRFLVPCGKSGTLSIIRLDDRRPVVEPVITTEPSARTAALDPATGRVYLPSARFGPPINGRRGNIEPGSFHIIVMAPG